MRLPVRPVNRKEPLLAPRGVELAKAGEALGFFKTILSNPYDPDSNPDGFINLGTAENVCPSLLYYINSEEVVAVRC